MGFSCGRYFNWIPFNKKTHSIRLHIGNNNKNVVKLITLLVYHQLDWLLSESMKQSRGGELGGNFPITFCSINFICKDVEESKLRNNNNNVCSRVGKDGWHTYVAEGKWRVVGVIIIMGVQWMIKNWKQINSSYYQILKLLLLFYVSAYHLSLECLF